MGLRLTVRTLGPNVSEGARLLFLALQGEGMTQAAARSAIGETVCAQGQLGRWLRGERKPATPARVAIHTRFGVPLDSWDQPLSEPFTLPAA